VNPILTPNRTEEVSYEDFLSRFKFKPDHHVTVCGPTGCGKSVLYRELLIPSRTFGVYFATKPRDKTIENSKMQGEAWGFTDDPKEIHPWVHKKWIVGLKKFGDPDSVKERHKMLFSATLNKCFGESGWPLFIDEGRYCCDPEYLGLRAKVAQYYIQGRSDDKPVILATQRPSWVPQEAFDQAAHIFFFNDEDLKNVDRMAEAAGASRKEFKELIPYLEITEDEGGQFLYYSRLTKQKLISKVEI
jgi:energy-coupling factor transporter ATP-binding protein EcfA2